jgi:hypothetical protein
LACAAALATSIALCATSCGGEAFSVAPAGDGGAAGDGGGAGGDSLGPADSPTGDEGPSGADAKPDGSVDGGAPRETGPVEGAPPPSDAPHEAAPGSVVYVSPNGDDANDGTDQAKPKKTIASALSRAKTILAGPEVHVCKGTYSETSLSLTQTLSLRGSYDCTIWQQTATYGYPSFDKVNLTVIENANPSLQAATLLISGTVTASALVDGFSIAGAANSAGTTYGVEVTGQASPVLKNDAIAGGAGTGASGKPGSVGVSIEGGSPEVWGCEVSGGSGTGSPGSLAIDVAPAATPKVHDLLAIGGTGTAASAVSDKAAIGIRVQASMSQASANALANLVVWGSDQAATGGSTDGIQVTGTNLAVDIESSAIVGGFGMGGGSSSSVGVEVSDASGTVRLLSDRIYAGSRGSGGATYGVFAAGAGKLALHNCEIHAGTMSGNATGVELGGAGMSEIVDSTIYTGDSGGIAIAIESGVQGVVVTDDLLLGANSASAAALTLRGCNGNELGSLDHTAFVNFNVLYACGTATAATLPTMVSMLAGTVQTLGDVEIASGATCAPPSCRINMSCPAAPGVCLPTILGASFAGNDGIPGLLGGAGAAGSDGGVLEAGSTDGGASMQGWTLPPGTLCVLARGGTPFTGIKEDLFGQTRDSNMPTIGAFEYVLTTCAN